MSREPFFKGLVFDENDQPVSSTQVGGKPFYVVNDAGFLRHIPSDQIDRFVLKQMTDQIKGYEDIISEQTAKMMGQEDPFTVAMLENQLKHLDEKIDTEISVGMTDDMRAYLGMVGLKIIVNIHGEVVQVIQPSSTSPEDEE